MGEADRLELQERLERICPNVYFQPPSTVRMTYPCIVYNRTGISDRKANNKTCFMASVYSLTVIDEDPTNTLPVDILQSFSMCNVNSSGVTDNLYHTYLTLYY